MVSFHDRCDQLSQIPGDTHLKGGTIVHGQHETCLAGASNESGLLALHHAAFCWPYSFGSLEMIGGCSFAIQTAFCCGLIGNFVSRPFWPRSPLRHFAALHVLLACSAGWITLWDIGDGRSDPESLAVHPATLQVYPRPEFPFSRPSASPKSTPG